MVSDVPTRTTTTSLDILAAVAPFLPAGQLNQQLWRPWDYSLVYSSIVAYDKFFNVDSGKLSRYSINILDGGLIPTCQWIEDLCDNIRVATSTCSSA